VERFWENRIQALLALSEVAILATRETEAYDERKAEVVWNELVNAIKGVLHRYNLQKDVERASQSPRAQRRAAYFRQIQARSLQKLEFEFEAREAELKRRFPSHDPASRP
jgi:hypothetical protein